MDTADAPAFNPPALDPETGVSLDAPEGLPTNHRLRAEALVAQGKTSDPGGEITDEFISSTAERLENEKRGREADEAKADASDPLAGSITDLRKHVGGMNDPAELATLRAREVADKGREGALAAIDTRIAALNKSTAETGDSNQAEN